MKYCQNCGSGMDDAASFCANCGTQQVQQPAPVQAPPQPEPPAPKSFCSGCGTELKPDSAFCPNCGTRTAAPAPAPAGGFNIDLKSIDWKALPNVVKGNVMKLQKNTQIFYLMSVGSLLLTAILVFFDMFSVSVSFMGYSQSETISLFPEAPAWTFVFFLLFVAGAAVSLFALYTTSKVNTNLLLGGAGVRALYVVILLMNYFDAASEMSALGSYSDMATFSFTVVGWLVVLISVAGFVGDFKSYTELKKVQF